MTNLEAAFGAIARWENFRKRNELHKMSYLFDTKLKKICNKVGFLFESKCAWIISGIPDSNGWMLHEL